MNTLHFIKIYLSILIFSILPIYAFAQKNSTQEKFSYEKEVAYGINFNTNGGLIGGFSVHYAKMIKPRVLATYSLEGVNIKHVKEQRIPSIIGEIFTPGKQNYLVLLRPHYGREWILFKRADEQGIQVNFLCSGGLSLGLVAPYIIEYQYKNQLYTVREQYDPAKHEDFTRMLRSTGFFGESLSKANAVVGGSFKIATAFEINTFRNNLTRFEAGVTADFMSKRVVIMPLAPHNNQNYLSAFFSICYGIRN
jgi:hypothetical protein